MPESYLQKASGDSLDNVTIEVVRSAIIEIQEMDDEHGAFWVGVFTDKENVLEVWKDLTIIAVFDADSGYEIRIKANDWNEVEGLYKIFLEKDFETLKQKFQSRQTDKNGDK